MKKIVLIILLVIFACLLFTVDLPSATLPGATHLLLIACKSLHKKQTFSSNLFGTGFPVPSWVVGAAHLFEKRWDQKLFQKALRAISSDLIFYPSREEAPRFPTHVGLKKFDQNFYLSFREMTQFLGSDYLRAGG